MRWSVKINSQSPAHHVGSVVVNQTCLGLSNALITMSPDVNDPLTIGEIENLIGAKVEIRWREDREGSLEQRFVGVADEILPSLSDGQQFIRIRVIPYGQSMQTSTWFRVFSKRNLDFIVSKIANDNNRRIKFSGKNPLIFFSIQENEDEISYLSRLAEEYGKIFYHDGEEFFLKDWGGEEEATNVSLCQISHIDTILNLAPINLELTGRIFNADKPSSLNSKNPKVSVEPLATVFKKSQKVYDKAELKLGRLIPEEEKEKDFELLSRRQIRQMVQVRAGTSIGSLTLGSAITFSDIPIIPARHRYRIAELTHEFGSNYTYSNLFYAFPDEITATPSSIGWGGLGASNSHAARGVVKNINDKESLGRATVVFPEADYSDESPPLPILTPYTGSGGCFFHPEPGDEILVFSPTRRLEESPVILGAFYSGKINSEYWKGKRGFRSGEVGVIADQENGRLLITAKEILFSVKGNMNFEVSGDLTQKASMIHLNP